MNLISKESKKSFKDITAAWALLGERVGLRVIRNEKQYRGLVAFSDQLIDQIGSDERSPLADLLGVVGALVEQYENETVHIQEAEPREVLSYLMEAHGLKQGDLRAEIGTQGVVSEVLKGKRALNARQAKALAERFGVSPAAFL